MMQLPRSCQPAALAGLALVLGGSAGWLAEEQEGPRRWLHPRPVEPAESRVLPSSMTLAPLREEELLEKGFDIAELLQRYEMHWTGGKLFKSRTTVRRFLTDEGVRQYGNLVTGVRSKLQDLYIDEAWIELPDGKRRAIDLDSIQIVTEGSSDVFSDVVNVVIPLEGLKPGATAVLVTRVVEQTGEWPLPSSEIVLPQGWTPVERFELEATWDETFRDRQLHADAEFLSCDCSARRCDCTADRIDPVQNGTESTIWLDVLPQIVVSEPHTWADLAGAESELISRSLTGRRTLRELAARLTRDARDDRDRLSRIHRFVADEIRYVGMEHGQSAVSPAAVERTLDLRYGDCKGKVALFLALADQAGISAFPVLVATGRNNLDKLGTPSWKYFNHMIACAEIAGEEGETCLDLTAPEADTGVLPPGLYGSVALDIREGADRPRTIPIPDAVWDIDVEAVNTMHCDGGLAEELRRTYRGAAAAWRRSALRGLPTEELRRWGVEEYRAVLGADTEPQVRFEGIDDPTAPVVLGSSTHYEGIISEEQVEYRESDFWLNHYARYFATTNERYPWFIAGVRIRSRMAYRLCSEKRVQFVGATLNLESEFGKLDRRYDRKPDRIEIDTTLELYPQTIRGENLERFQRFLDVTLEQTQAWFRMKPGGGFAP